MATSLAAGAKEWAQRSVGEIATEVPGAARLFEQRGIDFCCGGKQTLAEVCQTKSLDLEAILAELAAGGQKADQTDEHWREEPVESLTAHIVKRHHQYIRQEVPHLQTWLDKVVAVHGERHPELAVIRERFSSMAADMAQHMAKEEMILFPAIAKLSIRAAARKGNSVANLPPSPSSIAQPVRMMLMDHDHTGNDLGAIRKAANDFTLPDDACGTYRALYNGLAEFETDMHQHVHLENNILFPRALVMEEDAASAH